MNITNLEMTQATVEIFGAFICLMLVVIINISLHEGKSCKLLKWMFLSVSGMFISEACAYIFRGNVDILSLYMTRVSNFVVFMLNIALISLFVHYLYFFLQEKGVKANRIYKIIVDICVHFAVLILFVNQFTGWMYYFDENNCYHRNIGWYVYTLLILVCIITSSLMCITYRKSIRKTTFVSLLLYAYMPVIAIIIQIFIYGISITNIGIFAALIMMLITYLKEWSGLKERQEKERKTIEIVVLFVIMALSMSASVVSCIISIERISVNNSESNSKIIAHMVDSGIQNEFLRPIMVSETMSKDYSLKEFMKESNNNSPESVEEEVASYLDSIRTGFGYNMVFAVCDASRAYYTYNGISKFVDIENDEHDIWYKNYLEERKHYDLDVDTDEANNWDVSVFVNTEIKDENGRYLGACGVAVEMVELQELLRNYEETYNLKIDLINADGLIQVDSDGQRIERDYLDNTYLKNVGSNEFTYERQGQTSRMTKYMSDLDWYLVIEDRNPEKISVMEITISSIIIFLIGIMMMGIVFAIIGIRERKASREIAERRKTSLTDDMTGLLNRRAYEEDSASIVESGSVGKTTVVMMDVNGLKVANDTYGHVAGDELIIGAAKCMRTAMGEYGKVYRIGGDEFVALLECTDEQVEDMINTFEHITDTWKGSYEFSLSVSKGIVVCRQYPDIAFEDIKKMADQRMYDDKEAYYKRTGKTRRKL